MFKKERNHKKYYNESSGVRNLRQCVQSWQNIDKYYQKPIFNFETRIKQLLDRSLKYELKLLFISKKK